MKSAKFVFANNRSPKVHVRKVHERGELGRRGEGDRDWGGGGGGGGEKVRYRERVRGRKT